MGKIDYCSYADDRFPAFYRKRTCIWTNTDWTPQRPLCNKQCRGCDADGKHTRWAQQGTNKHGCTGHRKDQLYAIPPALPEELLSYIENNGASTRNADAEEI